MYAKGITVEPQENNLFEWKCTIKGAVWHLPVQTYSQMTNTPIHLVILWMGGRLFTGRFSVQGRDILLWCKLTSQLPFQSSYRASCLPFTVTGLNWHFPYERYSSLAGKVTFTTRIYHPGINEEGAICVPVLRDEVLCLTLPSFSDWSVFCLARSGNRPFHSHPVGVYDLLCIADWGSVLASIVLLTIREKVNNPSTDDPFEPDIAAVCHPNVYKERGVHIIIRYWRTTGPNLIKR